MHYLSSITTQTILASIPQSSTLINEVCIPFSFKLIHRISVSIVCRCILVPHEHRHLDNIRGTRLVLAKAMF